ncbi:MAG: PEP-utilizing enzyme [Aeromicrobium sp.]
MSDSSATIIDDVAFVPPGKGPWELEATHFSRPCTRIVQQCYAEGFVRGFKEGTERYGLLLSHLKPGVAAEFQYLQPVAVGAPEGAMGPPPKLVLMALSRVHPALRKRIDTAVTAFAERRWRADLEHWDAVDKPAAIERHLAIQEVDVGQLSDDELADHLDICVDHLTESVYLHHKYTIPACLPVGDFMAGAHEWTGAPLGELMELVRGCSEISRGFAAEELQQAVKSLATSDDARHVMMESGSSTDVLTALAARPDVGATVRDYLDAVRWRCVGYDVGDAAAGELPDVLLETLRRSVVHTGASDDDDDDRGVAALRARVPVQHHADFDERLADVRLMYRLRDERGVYADGWATGLARRGLLEAGRRLTSAGLLRDPAHGPYMEQAEVNAALRDGVAPDAEEIERRFTWRTTRTIADAPPFLNALPAPPPPTEWLPPKARRSATAIGIFLHSLFDVPTTPNTDTVLTGLAVNTGTYEGRARVVDSSDDFDRIKDGDVLVTRMTSPYFNVVLPLLGAIVTDRGGQLSHAAIVAREYGIPGIVGTRDATRMIADGARVRVDGATGEVRLLG